MIYDFPKNKTVGRDSEHQFAQLIARRPGGHAAYIGHVPGMENSAPVFLRHHQTDSDGFVYTVAPDLLINLPGRGPHLVQVKKKDLVQNELAFYLDELELHRMRMSAAFLPTLFVVHAQQLACWEGLGEWVWLDVRDLAVDRAELHKREVRDKKTFVVPLRHFKPIDAFLRNPNEHQPANTDQSPRPSQRA
jgi:hypothetical protein